VSEPPCEGGAGAAHGIAPPTASPEDALEFRLKRLMLLRLVMVTTLLLVAAWVEAADYLLPFNPLYVIIGATYGLTVLHALALRYTRRLGVLAVAQVVGDLAVITGLVWLTGGTLNADPERRMAGAGFMLLYPISVLSGGVLLSRLGAVSLAGVATAVYAGLLGAVWRGWVSPRGLADIPLLAPSALLYSVFVTGVACFTVALVASYLAASLRSVGAQLEVAEEQVADLRELNEAIVDSIHSGLVTTSADGRVQTINGFGEVILGRAGSAVRGRPIDEVFASQSLSPEVLRRRAVDVSLSRVELGYERPDGSLVQLGISIWPLSSAGASVGEGQLVVFQDLTEIKRLEDDIRMKEKLAAVGEMASQLAHEIRNPLGAISGSAQVLLGGSNMTADQSRLLEIITRESRRLSDTLNRFLMQARSESLRAVPVDLGPVIERAVVLLRNSPEVGPRRVVLYEASPGPFVCMADADQIVQVFWNLARNGLEAMSAGGGVLGIRLTASKDEVVLSVHDEGPGVEGAETGRLFEPFYSGRSMGTGLGLAIVYRIVREHRGDISVSSTPGRGTEVQVRLPLMRTPVVA
jgi:two-component system sensor histidine kinase PilS (NtrC family)